MKRFCKLYNMVMILLTDFRAGEI
uniref:Uncharacterized protein n=1 Tax=Rhizophora mucronata TaxID=61149 RepID=A0A2P2Q800_RHIMU